jgi:uncharacterized protein YecT (DUF1311 family)
MTRLAALLVLLAAPAGAQDTDAGPAPAERLQACLAAAEVASDCVDVVARACFEEPGSETTLGGMRCAQEEEAAWNAVRADAESELTAGLSELGAATWDSAAEAWGEWRDRQCAFEASIYEGGSLAKVVAAGCRARFAAERALYVRDQLEFRTFDGE